MAGVAVATACAPGSVVMPGEEMTIAPCLAGGRGARRNRGWADGLVTSVFAVGGSILVPEQSFEGDHLAGDAFGIDAVGTVDQRALHTFDPLSVDDRLLDE